MMTADQFGEALAPWLEQVKALADSRPDIKPTSFQISVKCCSRFGLSFSPAIFYGKDKLVMAHLEPSLDKGLEILKARLAEIPAPPTREELIAQKRAELAELEGGQR